MKGKITKRAVDTLEPGMGAGGKAKAVFLWDTELTGFGCKVTAGGTRVYLLQYRVRGAGRSRAPRRITLGRHGVLTADQARTLAADLLLRVRAGEDPAEALQARETPTVATLVTRYLMEYLPTKKRPPRQSTRDEYERLLTKHVLPVLGSTPVADVDENDIERLHQSLGDTPYLANRVLTVLKNAFDQAERFGWRAPQSNPAAPIERYPEAKRGEKKEVMLTAEQMRVLLASIDVEEEGGADPYACAAIRVAFWTGWRINSEVLRLQWDHIDQELGRARLLTTKTRVEEYRMVPEAALSIIGALQRVDGNPYVFPGRAPGQHLTTVRGPWRRVRARADLGELEGLGALRLHDLRHNVVSWDVSRGVPLEIAGKNVGHRSRRSTEIYAHFAPDALKQAADARADAMRGAVDQSTLEDVDPQFAE